MKSLLFILLASFITTQRVLRPGRQASEVPAAIYEPTMSAGIDLSSIPNLSPKSVGSGTCAAGTFSCPTDCERCWESCGNCPRPEDVYGCPGTRQWVLSFDDGPSDYTPELLDVLRRYGIRAVFCIVGGRADKYKDTIKRMYDEGHLIVSHSWSHPHLISLSTTQVIAEIVTTERALTDIISVKPKYFRPPYGEADDRIKGILRAYGLVPLLWNVDSLDWDVINDKQPFSQVLDTFRGALNGQMAMNPKNDTSFISLNHDIFLETVRNAPDIIEMLRGSGVTFTTVANCLGDTTPYRSWTGALISGNVNGAPVAGASAPPKADPSSSGSSALGSAVVTFGGR